MNEILLDGKSLYYPGDTINAVTEAIITEALNDSGYMDITVPPTNPLYDYIYERKSVIEVKKNSFIIWEGEVVDISENMKKENKLYVVGVMSYLNDSVQEKKEYLNKTAIQILGELVNEHNNQVESRKHFVLGVVTIDVPEGIMNLETNFESTLSVIREKICNEYGGYIRIRWVDGIRYLDIVKIEDYGNTCLQPIQFGRNLLDYAKNLSASSIVTCVVPLGAEAEDGNFLTIKSVNNGQSYVFNQEAVDSFGWIRKAVKFKDITEAQALFEAGEKWLAQNQYAKLAIEVNAVDLSLLKANIDSFNLGDYVNAKAKPFGLDAWYYIRKKVTDLLHPDKNTITIGDTILKSYTQQIQQEVGNIEKEIPSASKILLAAKQNASNLIKSATNGYIVLNMDENGNPEELLVMDIPDIETAKKIWRWNINGLGYSSTGYDGEYGTAMTMDGAIVADFITAGTMYADRIKGGTLTLGGTDNNNGVLSVLDKNGKEVGRWDNSGILLPPGTRLAWSQITGTDDIANKNDIPTNISQLNNDAHYATTGQIPTNTSQLNNDSNFATEGQIPTSTSQLKNDSGYATTDDIPKNTSDLNNDSNFATVNQIPTDNSQLKNGAGYATEEQIPTNNNQLENGAGYTTMTDVEEKGYQNASQVTQITKDTVTTEYVNALKIKAESVDAENITGKTISGKKIKGSSLETAADYQDTTISINNYGIRRNLLNENDEIVSYVKYPLIYVDSYKFILSTETSHTFKLPDVFKVVSFKAYAFLSNIDYFDDNARLLLGRFGCNITKDGENGAVTITPHTEVYNDSNNSYVRAYFTYTIIVIGD